MSEHVIFYISNVNSYTTTPSHTFLDLGAASIAINAMLTGIASGLILLRILGFGTIGLIQENLSYEKALSFGALCGKLLGAGGGGFMLLLVPRKSQAAVIKALEPMLNVPFSFESQGTCIPFFTR